MKTASEADTCMECLQTRMGLAWLKEPARRRAGGYKAGKELGTRGKGRRFVVGKGSSRQAQLLGVLEFLWGLITEALSLICILEMLLQWDESCKQHKI